VLEDPRQGNAALTNLHRLQRIAECFQLMELF
jgi:hypothetical protein